MSLTVRPATRADIPLLSKLGRETFFETFVEGFRIPYSESDLAEFLPRAYGEAALEAYFDDPAYAHFVAEFDGAPVGYALVGPNGLPHEDARDGDGELKRIYLLKSAQGTGGGRALYEACTDFLLKDGPRRIWLGVWSGNEKAQEFYRKNGYAKVGEYRFRVGETLDHEFIMRRD
jgi:ribosomal protein S18 acetylase RimI-like enzyme